MTKYETAAAALAASETGGRVMYCTLAEARRLEGRSAVTSGGYAGVYAAPIAYAPQQPHDTAQTWNVPVGYALFG